MKIAIVGINNSLIDLTSQNEVIDSKTVGDTIEEEKYYIDQHHSILI